MRNSKMRILMPRSEETRVHGGAISAKCDLDQLLLCQSTVDFFPDRRIGYRHIIARLIPLWRKNLAKRSSTHNADQHKQHEYVDMIYIG